MENRNQGDGFPEVLKQLQRLPWHKTSPFANCSLTHQVSSVAIFAPSCAGQTRKEIAHLVEYLTINSKHSVELKSKAFCWNIELEKGGSTAGILLKIHEAQQKCMKITWAAVCPLGCVWGACVLLGGVTSKWEATHQSQLLASSV